MLTCNRCKNPSENLMVGGMHTNGNKWLICRKCNTEKFKKFRQRASYRQSLIRALKRASEKHKVKWIARQKARYAVKTGVLIKPKKCEVCEQIKPLQGHHEDYTKPLDVIWLCSGCHADADRTREIAPN